MSPVAEPICSLLDALDGAKHGGVGGDYGDRRELVDKILTAVIVWLLLRQLPIRTTRHFPAMAAVR